MITLPCAGCRTPLQVADNLAGKKARCPRCGQVVCIPAGAAVSPVTPPSPQRPPLASPPASPAPAVTAASPTAASASADASAGDTYEVQSGDTLLTIAEQSYSDATQWRRIYDANKDVIGGDPDKLKIGMKLKIPPKQS